MIKFLRKSITETPEIPEFLDRRILLAAGLQAAANRRRRRYRRWLPLTGAAAAVVAGIVFFSQQAVPESQQEPDREWMMLEQANYNLNCQLNCENAAVNPSHFFDL